MHFRVQMVVRLKDPLTIEGGAVSGCEDGSAATGYVIVIGVNAPDIATAVRDAQVVALRPKQKDSSFRTFDGFVEEAKVERIEKTDWDQYVVEHAARIDEPGVYYSTGLIFFNHDAPKKNWWQFWK